MRVVGAVAVASGFLLGAALWDDRLSWRPAVVVALVLGVLYAFLGHDRVSGWVTRSEDDE